MVVIDTSAWIEYFRNGEPAVVKTVDTALDRDLVVMGDLIYCEVLQGIKNKRELEQVSTLFQSLPRYEMVGFKIAEKSAANNRFLRSKGVTVRKTIDIIIGTFCIEHKLQLIHHDRDFELMAPFIGIKRFTL